MRGPWSVFPDCPLGFLEAIHTLSEELKKSPRIHCHLPVFAVFLVSYNPGLLACIPLSLFAGFVQIECLHTFYFHVQVLEFLADNVRAVCASGELLAPACSKASFAEFITPLALTAGTLGAGVYHPASLLNSSTSSHIGISSGTSAGASLATVTGKQLHRLALSAEMKMLERSA